MVNLLSSNHLTMTIASDFLAECLNSKDQRGKSLLIDVPPCSFSASNKYFANKGTIRGRYPLLVVLKIDGARLIFLALLDIVYIIHCLFKTLSSNAPTTLNPWGDTPLSMIHELN